MITISSGWKTFIGAWRAHSLSQAAEWMYRMNVFARNAGRHTITEQIYDLKDELIKYLYQHDYAVEVIRHIQNRECRTCGGSGQYWTGADCFRCHGTGTFSTTALIAFRFVIEGRRYGWHQLEKLIDYPVTLTAPDIGEYKEPARGEAILSMDSAWEGCCAVWWVLFWHGRWTPLLLFPSTRAWLKAKLSIKSGARRTQ